MGYALDEIDLDDGFAAFIEPEGLTTIAIDGSNHIRCVGDLVHDGPPMDDLLGIRNACPPPEAVP